MKGTGFETTIQWIAPVLVALVYILLNSLIHEPHRKSFHAIMLAGAGAGAAYLSGGGFGLWEIAFCAAMAAVAWNGLRFYSFMGIGWLLHTGWDVPHHLYGHPLLPFDPTSSRGGAICDPVLAVWSFMGAPPLFDVLRRKHSRSFVGN